MVNPVAFLGSMPKIEGFSPMPSSSAEAFMVFQTADMMLVGGAGWSAGQRLVKSLSNEAFNELMGRKKVQVGGAPLDVQLAQKNVTEGLWQLLEPHIKGNHSIFMKKLEMNKDVQDRVIKEAMELEKDKMRTNAELIRWMFTNIPELAKAMLSGDFSGLGGEKKIYEKGETHEFELTEQEKEVVRERDPRNKKPSSPPTQTEKPTPKPKEDIVYTIRYKLRPSGVVGRQCRGRNTYILYGGATARPYIHKGTKKQLGQLVSSMKTQIGRMKGDAENQLKAMHRDGCGRRGWQNMETGRKYTTYLNFVKHYNEISKRYAKL